MAATKLPLKPIGGNILVKPDKAEEVTQSGLVIAASKNEEKAQKGEIIALGTGKVDKDGKKEPFNVEVGQRVIFKKYSPDEVEVDNVKYLIMQEDDILAVLI